MGLRVEKLVPIRQSNVVKSVRHIREKLNSMKIGGRRCLRSARPTTNQSPCCAKVILKVTAQVFREMIHKNYRLVLPGSGVNFLEGVCATPRGGILAVRNATQHNNAPLDARHFKASALLPPKSKITAV